MIRALEVALDEATRKARAARRLERWYRVLGIGFGCLAVWEFTRGQWGWAVLSGGVLVLYAFLGANAKSEWAAHEVQASALRILIAGYRS